MSVETILLLVSASVGLFVVFMGAGVLLSPGHRNGSLPRRGRGSLQSTEIPDGPPPTHAPPRPAVDMCACRLCRMPNHQVAKRWHRVGEEYRGHGDDASWTLAELVDIIGAPQSHHVLVELEDGDLLSAAEWLGFVIPQRPVRILAMGGLATEEVQDEALARVLYRPRPRSQLCRTDFSPDLRAPDLVLSHSAGRTPPGQLE